MIEKKRKLELYQLRGDFYEVKRVVNTLDYRPGNLLTGDQVKAAVARPNLDVVIFYKK